jgi:hypothetical protein
MMMIVLEEDDTQTLNVQVVHQLEREVSLFYRLHHHQLFVMKNHHLIFFDEY